jgi:hypothetical protein
MSARLVLLRGATLFKPVGSFGRCSALAVLSRPLTIKAGSPIITRHANERQATTHTSSTYTVHQSLHTSAILRLAQQGNSKGQRNEEEEALAASSSFHPTSQVTSSVSNDKGPSGRKEYERHFSHFTYAPQYQPQRLSEDILTIPNVLTILRLASTPVLGYLILIDEMPYALGLLALSAFTDVLDGWLARRYGSATVFGSIADPAADKALMTVMVGALAWRGLIPRK